MSAHARDSQRRGQDGARAIQGFPVITSGREGTRGGAAQREQRQRHQLEYNSFPVYERVSIKTDGHAIAD
jgi:hypothetical protein